MPYLAVMNPSANQKTIIVGLDVGTTGVKVLAATAQGETLAVAENTYGLSQPKSGWREQDPELILQATEKALKQVFDQIDQPVTALCFGAAMHSLLAVNQEGKALCPAMIWADVRSNAYASTLRESVLGQHIYEASGAPIHAMLPLCKIAWLRDQQPEIFRRTHKFISIKEYILYRWFGTYLVDYSIAGATGMWDKSTLGWKQEALDWAGISAAQLSRPVATTHRLGKPEFTTFQHQRITDDCIFVMGSSDGCLANLNASGFSQEDATLTLGTSGAIRITAQKTEADPTMSIFDYVLHDAYHVIGGPTNNGGIVLEWLKQKFYPDVTDSATILELAQAIAPGAEGLVCVPYFFGERAPLWREDVVGKFDGVLSQHSRDHFARAALEGIIYNLYGIALNLQKASSTRIRGIWIDGGLTRSDFIAQLIADVFNLPVYRSASSHGVARGAVLLAGHALQLLEVVAPQKKDVFHADPQTHAQLIAVYTKFAALRDAY